VETEVVVPSENAASAALVEGEGEVPQNLEAELRKFLCERVRSTEALDVLGVLAAPPVRWWHLTNLTRDLGIAESIVEVEIQTLFETGLLIRTPDRARLRDEPGSPVHDLVQQALAAYRERRVEIVQLLSSRAVGRIRSSLAALLGRLLSKRLIISEAR